MSAHVEVIVDLYHGGIGTCAQALNFEERELFIGRSLAVANVEVRLNGLEDGGRVAQHAGCCCANLDEMLSYRFSVDFHKAVRR